MQLQTTSPESKFPIEYSHVILIQIDINIWESYCKNTKGSRFYESRCIYRLSTLDTMQRIGVWEWVVI